MNVCDPRLWPTDKNGERIPINYDRRARRETEATFKGGVTLSRRIRDQTREDDARALLKALWREEKRRRYGWVGA